MIIILGRLSALVISALLASSVTASRHTVTLVNRCGTPTTMQIPGRGNFGAGTHTFDGDIRGGIAQACRDINGVGCNSIEFTLVDGISSADITLIPPHRFDHPAQFKLNNNAATGAVCNRANCGPKNAFYKFNDYSAQRQVSGPGANCNTLTEHGLEFDPWPPDPYLKAIVVCSSDESTLCSRI